MGDAIKLAAQFENVHSLRVMLDGNLSSENEFFVAALHGVAGFCPAESEVPHITLPELRNLGYSDTVIGALSVFAKQPLGRDAYRQYIESICKQRLGEPRLVRKVMLACLRDCADRSRFSYSLTKEEHDACNLSNWAILQLANALIRDYGNEAHIT